VQRRARLARARVVCPRGALLLDLGCGSGAQTCELAHWNCAVIAVDIAREGVRALQRHVHEKGLASTSPVQADATRLPLATGSVDLVTCFDVLEHVADEYAVLSEIHRVLKPSGRIILSVPNKAWLFETHGAYLPLLAWNRVPFFSWLPRRIHRQFAKARIYRRREVVDLLQRHSFRIKSAQYLTAPLEPLHGWLGSMLRATLFRGDSTRIPWLATAIIVHADRA
jgi:2-polyprenyl-3-methyl-5-hydroxy-6-metoxy-1,4-benzoquinol methylase